MAKSNEENEPQHRGRIQAQGGKLEESESWAQDEPLNLEDGLALLETLKNKLTKKEFEIWQDSFERARNFIIQAAENGGIDAQVSKTFKVKKTRDIRVDIEVIKGTAFVRINLENDEEQNFI